MSMAFLIMFWNFILTPLALRYGVEKLQFKGPDNYFSRICFDQSLADGQLEELIRNHIQSPKWN